MLKFLTLIQHSSYPRFIAVISFYILKIIANDDTFLPLTLFHFFTKSFFMKFKTIVLGWIVMCMCQAAISQVSFGVQGGASFFKVHRSTDIKITDMEGMEQNVPRRFSAGYYVALVTDIPIKNNFSVQGELSIARKGEAFVFNTFGIENDLRIEFRSQYLELPIMVKYKFLFGEKTGLELGVGLSAGYLLETKAWTKQYDKASSEEDLPILTDYNDDGVKTNRWDVSPIVDIAIPFKTGFGDFRIGLRGSFDVTNANFYEDDSSLIRTENLYNWGMMLYGGYTMNKGHFGKKEISSGAM